MYFCKQYDAKNKLALHNIIIFIKMKKRILLLGMLFIGIITQSYANVKLSYEVTPDTAGHYLNVELTCENTTKPFLLKMPVWAPGYYVIVDFPKYLTDFSAQDTNGKQLIWTKEGKNGWTIHPQGTITKIKYRIYANKRSVAECRVEDQMAFIAPNGVFMYVDGEKDTPITIHYQLPSNWQHISTGLKNIGKNTFEASDADVLYDSPVLLGNHFVKKFSYEGHNYEFALETPNGFEQTNFEEDFKKMVSATTRLMGDVPYNQYCLIHLGKGQGGLEHHNSQACYTDGSFHFSDAKAYKNYMGFTTHEYFHLYNVKSIRPIELGPFNYDHEVFTPLLWVSEGFTVYYETRIMLAAGIITMDDLLDDLSEHIKEIESHEGKRHMSLRQSSYDIWLNFFNQSANGKDVRISYYEKGPILGLLFDIELRRLTNGKKSLDDLMRLLYNRYYITLKRGFTEQEFWTTTEEIAGQAVPLLRKYVDTTEEIDYDFILNQAGIRLDRKNWKLTKLEHPNQSQLKLRRLMWGK